MQRSQGVGTTAATATAATLFLWALTGCGGPNDQGPPPSPTVEVATSTRQDVTSYYHYTGNLEAVAKVDVRARVPGTLEEKHFRVSSPVQVGDKLFSIEPLPYDVAIQSAEAQVQVAQAALDLAQLEKDQIQEAFSQKAANERELQKYIATLKTRQAELLQARAQLQNAQLQRSYADVNAPIAGRVSRELVDVGTLVGVSEPTLLTTVVQMDPIHVYVDVSERIVLEYLNENRDGQVNGESAPEPPMIEIARANDPDGTFPFVGQIDYVDSVVDEATGTLRVRGSIPNPDGRLFPGLFVRARVPYDQIKDAILVREDALGTDLTGKFLLVVDEQDVVSRVAVKLGDKAADGTIVVTEGLTGDERYVVAGIQKARPGSKVTIREGKGPRDRGAGRPSKNASTQGRGAGTSVPVSDKANTAADSSESNPRSSIENQKPPSAEPSP